uniref:Uncharacterized protein n=1 Tax=Rhodnius prolixus TaxID=13249 RepID=T1I5R3_RHOPR
MAMVVRRTEEREALRSVIAQWNANRLDLFELSEPNQVICQHTEELDVVSMIGTDRLNNNFM